MTKARTIEQLKDEFNDLNERKIKAHAQLEAATSDLEKLQAEAIAEFQTCDIAELETKLKEMEAENEKRRREYQELLDSISLELKKIESDTESVTPNRTDTSDD